MLDLGYVRANLDRVKEKLEARGMDAEAVLNAFRVYDANRRVTIADSESLNAQRNKLSQEIGALIRAGDHEAAEKASQEVRAIKLQIELLPKAADTAARMMRDLLEIIPNLPQDSVPIGKSEHNNRVEKTWDREEKPQGYTPSPLPSPLSHTGSSASA